MTVDMYERPNRDKIAAQVNGNLPGAQPRQQPAPDDGDVTARFAVHLRARMKARGWTQKHIEDRAQLSAIIAAKAVNGTSVTLDLADRLADLVGMDLRSMLAPYTCHTCAGDGHPGFTCNECGKEVPLD